MRPKGFFIFECLYHSKVAAKPAKLFSQLPCPPLSVAWYVKTSCLGGGEDRCEEEMCSHIGSSLSPSCLLRALQRAGFTTG